MATVQYFDALAPTTALDPVGGSGMLPLEALAGSYPSITSTDQDDGSRVRQLIYSGLPEHRKALHAVRSGKSGNRGEKAWCNAYPKCVLIFRVEAKCLDKATIAGIFGAGSGRI